MPPLDVLGAQHIPAEHVLKADWMYNIEQLDATEFYQELELPITGTHRCPG
jgi:hypothetical protein